jgi:4-hydroxybenzoate polyprenyltransferase
MKMIIGLTQSARLKRSLGVGIVIGILSNSLAYGIGGSIFLMFSFVFNDWVDADKDAIGHPHRAIPSGKITRKQALYFAALFLAGGFGQAWYFLPQFFTAFIAMYTLSVVYSFLLKPNVPIIATPVWSLAIAILFVRPFSEDMWVYGAVTAIVYAYEILLDYRDRVSDKEFCKTPTLANILGKNTIILAGLIFLASSIFLLQEIAGK